MLKEKYIINEFQQRILYKEPINKIGQLDANLHRIRMNKQPKKYVSDRKVLGEYIDNIRANMGYDNKDLSKNIKTEKITINNVNCRIYKSSNKKSPCIVMIHGGSFIGGSLDVVENPCKKLAEYIKGSVLSIDYTLAPEEPYPCSIMECKNVCEYLNDNKEELNISDIYIMGDSAGGNIAIGVTNFCEFIKGLIVYYPVTDLSLKIYKEMWNEDLYNIKDDLEAKKCINSLKGSESMMTKLYIQGKEKLTHPLVSPIYREKMINTLLISAEFDYLRIQAEYFAAKFVADVIRYGGVNHAFLDKFGDLEAAEDSLQEIAKWIERNEKNEF